MNDSEMDELFFLWQEYGKEIDKKLTSDAIQLKKAVREYVKNLPKFLWYYQPGNYTKFIPQLKKEEQL